MRITPINLAKRVERWQKRLAPLGLAHFRIQSVTLCDETPGGRDAKATVIVSSSYDDVRFYFTHDFIEEADARELDEVILHEWLHVAFRDMDRVFEAVESWMPEATHRDFTESVEHEREGLIDRLARTMHAFWQN